MDIKIEGNVFYGLPNIEIRLSKIELGDLVIGGKLSKQLEYWGKPSESYPGDSGRRTQGVSIIVEG